MKKLRDRTRVSQGKTVAENQEQEHRAIYVSVTLSSILFGAMYLVLSTRLD